MTGRPWKTLFVGRRSSGCSRSAVALPFGILRTPAVCLHNVSAVSSIRLMSEVLYARVPSETKGAIDAFAGANGRSVAAAVAELLSRGLQATSQSSQIAELQERLQRTELALARKDVELHEAKLALESFGQPEGERTPRRPGELPTSARTAQEGS